MLPPTAPASKAAAPAGLVPLQHNGLFEYVFRKLQASSGFCKAFLQRLPDGAVGKVFFSEDEVVKYACKEASAYILEYSCEQRGKKAMTQQSPSALFDFVFGRLKEHNNFTVAFVQRLPDAKLGKIMYTEDELVQYVCAEHSAFVLQYASEQRGAK